MRDQVQNRLGFLKTTAIGGVVFLLPLIVIGALVGQVVPIVMTVADVLSEVIPAHTVVGWTVVLTLAILVLLFGCFLSGLAARRSFAKQFSSTIEKNLLLLYPRYAIVKEQMTGAIGGDELKHLFKPVMVQWMNVSRIAFEVERAESGRVAIFLPGAPDPWSGEVVYMNADQVTPLAIEFSDAAATCERLGRHSIHLLA